MSVELLNDKVPMYIHNKHTTYENTVLQEHASIVTNLRDTGTSEALIESQGRLLIGLCLKEKTQEFIRQRFDDYYKEELELLKYNNGTAVEKQNAAVHRVWLRLINDAMDVFINKYKVDGSRAKIAVIDDVMPDGRVFADPKDLPVELTDDEGDV